MRGLFTLSCLLLMIGSLKAQVLEQDSLALVGLYNSTNGVQWTNNTRWLSGPISGWYGIAVNSNRVEEISLYENNLAGTLPVAIGDLTALRRLDLANNALSGELPATLGNCIELRHINILVNMFTGTIPIELAGCQQLTDFIAYKNDFSGPFPEVFLHLPNIERIELGTNQFTGPLPVWLDSLDQLRVFTIDRNDFSGPMPSIKHMTSLVEVHLRENRLEGMFDTILGYHPNMYYFTFSDNSFTGCVSESHFNPDRLWFLHLNNNDFTCVGDFSAFADTGELRRIWCGGNQLTFDDLELNKDVGIFEYSPQDSLLQPETHIMSPGDSIEISAGTGGMYTTYQWYKDNAPIPGEVGASIAIKDFDTSAAGTYYCEAKNDSLPTLTLYRYPVEIMPLTSSTSKSHERALRCYPNPTTDVIRFEGLSDIGVVSIFDALGELVSHKTVELNSAFSLSNLGNGLYFIRVEAQNNMYVSRVLKTGVNY